MTIYELRQVTELSKAIGVYTFGDLLLFLRLEGWRSDNLITALEHYRHELEAQ